MKKWITAVLAALLALSVSAAFVACGDGETPGGDGGNGGNTDPKSYTVTKTESDLYDYGWSTTTATAGTAAYVEVTPEYEAVSIAAVYYNGQACTKDAENEERYNFTMPAEDVTITVDVAFTDRAEDSFLSWDASDVATLVSAYGDEDYNNDQYWGTPGLIEVTAELSNTVTGADQTFYSSDESVIPVEALDFDEKTNSEVVGSSGHNGLVGGTLIIDRSKIQPGTAQIALLWKNTNGPSLPKTALLVTTVNVTAAA